MNPRRTGSRLLVAGLVVIAMGAGPMASVRAANDLEDAWIGPEAKPESPFGGYLAGNLARAVGDSKAAA